MKLTRQFIEDAYPPDQGWEFTDETDVLGIPIAFALRNGQFCVLIPALSNEPYVSESSLMEARNLAKLYRILNEAMCVQVVMVYEHLLYRPMHVSGKDIVVFSLESCPVLTTQNQEPHVCTN